MTTEQWRQEHQKLQAKFKQLHEHLKGKKNDRTN